MSISDLMSVNVAAKRLGWSRRTVLRKIADGTIPARRLSGTDKAAYVLNTDDVETLAAELRAARIAELEQLTAEASA